MPPWWIDQTNASSLLCRWQHVLQQIQLIPHLTSSCSQHQSHLHPPGGLKPHDSAGPSLVWKTRRHAHQLLITHPWANHQHKMHGCWNAFRVHCRHVTPPPEADCHRKVFHSQDIESITGKLGYIASAAPWSCFLLPDLYAEITTCLKSHHNYLYMTNKQFCTLLKLQCDQGDPHNHRTFAMTKTSKATHLIQQQHFISKRLSNLMDLIISILEDELVSRCCPIAPFIPRDPSAIAYLDSLSHEA